MRKPSYSLNVDTSCTMFRSEKHFLVSPSMEQGSAGRSWAASVPGPKYVLPEDYAGRGRMTPGARTCTFAPHTPAVVKARPQSAPPKPPDRAAVERGEKQLSTVPRVLGGKLYNAPHARREVSPAAPCPPFPRGPERCPARLRSCLGWMRAF